MKYSFWKDNDWTLIITILLLSAFGLLMVFSASYVLAYTDQNLQDPYYFIKRQVMWFGLASLVFLFVMHFPYRFYRKLSVIVIVVSIILLILVKMPGIGHTVSGAERWIRLPGLGVIQPSEFVKLGVIIYLAQVYTQKQAYIDKFLTGVMPPLIMVGVIFGLIMLQPDLGTATSIMIVAILLAFFSGARFRHLFGLISVGAVMFIFFVRDEPYRMQRITSFTDPFAEMWGDGYQLIQSYIAIAHGGLSGTGLGLSVQKLLYLPEAHTDFILAIIAEELGIFGVLFVFICYSIIIFRGVVIGTRCKSPFGSLLAFGITFQLAIQIVFNVGAVTGLLPITGVPLPLLSNGGSSLLVSFIGLAIVANISRNNIRQQRLKGQLDEQVPA
ncbi:putative lipid II flippase FtsW [Alkalihalobacillus sp. 1P02AB]|uniref:putative lipid II flippase FtsW n=1 Tax=Alkalihalobacillus sp. 1P02AB TaxID=3132260 RepID=UPI0039A65CC7